MFALLSLGKKLVITCFGSAKKLILDLDLLCLDGIIHFEETPSGVAETGQLNWLGGGAVGSVSDEYYKPSFWDGMFGFLEAQLDRWHGHMKRATL